MNSFIKFMVAWFLSWKISDNDKRAFAYAVFLRESEKGKELSELATKHNNLFGMRVPSTRNYHNGAVTYGSRGTFATFPTIWHSVTDFIARASALNSAWKQSVVARDSYYLELVDGHLFGKFGYLGDPPQGGEKERQAYKDYLLANKDRYSKIVASVYLLDVVLFGALGFLFYTLYQLYKSPRKALSKAKSFTRKRR